MTLTYTYDFYNFSRLLTRLALILPFWKWLRSQPYVVKVQQIFWCAGQAAGSHPMNFASQFLMDLWLIYG